MREKTITALLLIVALIHVLPIGGFFGAARLESLYGITISGSETEILMRHRAVLFCLLGLFFAYAAFTPSVQPVAFLIAFAALASFFYLAFSVGEYNNAIRTVVRVDMVAAAFLAGAIFLFCIKREG